MIDYLEMVGKRPGGDDWRWLLQAIVLARFRAGDNDRALVLAHELAAQWQPGRPLWMKEMPAFVMTAAGDRKAAYALMLAVLRDETGKVSQPELNSTIIFMCTRILTLGGAIGESALPHRAAKRTAACINNDRLLVDT